MTRRERAVAASRVLVAASHPLRNPSMRRYSHLVAQAYAGGTIDYRLVEPSDALSRRLTSPVLRKWVIYFEQLLFGLRLATISSRRTLTHVVDHSDALYALVIRGPVVITCHDLIAVRAARGELEEFRPRSLGRAYQALVVAGLRRAQAIFAVSEATRRDVDRLIGGPCEVLLNPIDPRFAAANVSASSDPGDYALIVSTHGWRKRRDLALRWWIHLRTLPGGPQKLRVVGPPLTPHENAIIEEAAVQGFVSVQMGLSDLELIALYSDAAFLLQMSKYEGFAWPVVEANIQGTPALCADIEILRETGAGNVFVDPAETPSTEQASDVLRRLAQLKGSHFLTSKVQVYSFTEFSSRLAELVSPIAQEAPR